jgi:type IV secretory pathway TrbD component
MFVRAIHMRACGHKKMSTERKVVFTAVLSQVLQMVYPLWVSKGISLLHYFVVHWWASCRVASFDGILEF